MHRSRDALGDDRVARKLLKGGLKTLLAAFGLRPKLAQLTPEVIGIDMRLVAFKLDGIHLRFHVHPQLFKFLDFEASLLQRVLTAASAGSLCVYFFLKHKFPLFSISPLLVVRATKHALHTRLFDIHRVQAISAGWFQQRRIPRTATACWLAAVWSARGKRAARAHERACKLGGRGEI